MKMRKLLAGMMATAMVASVTATAVSAADINWTDIIGLNAEKTSEYHIVNSDGKLMTDDDSVLQPNTTYYVLLGTSDIYQNYMNYEKLVKIGVKSVTNGDKLVPGSVKLSEKYFSSLGNRYTVIEFKLIDDMTDNELNLYFNVELSARKNLDLKIGVDKFPVVVGERSTSTTVNTNNAANTQVLGRANEAYRLVGEMINGIPALSQARVRLTTALTAASVQPANVYVGHDANALNKQQTWFTAATTTSTPTLAQVTEVVNAADALYAATVSYVNNFKVRLNTVAGYSDLQTALGANGTIVNTLMNGLFDGYPSNPTTGSLAGVTMAGTGSTAAAWDGAFATLYGAAQSGVVDATGAIKTYQNALSTFVAGTDGMVGDNYVQGANYLNKDDTLIIPVKVWFKNSVVKGPDTDLTVGTGRQWYEVTKNEWNEVIWEDGDNEIARLYFHADSNTKGFYSQLKTTWSNEWYRQYFAHADAYKFEFVGTPSISTTHRATLALYMPFLDSNGLSYKSDPTDVYIYRINDADGTIEDMTEYFSYKVDSNGKGWYEASSRVLSTYVISSVPANLPVENVEIVPDATIQVPDVKVPANTGR